MNYLINEAVYERIWSFYSNVAKKYKHTYSYEDLEADYKSACHSIYKIENGLLRRKPTISRWKGLFMANTKKWYYAYRIEGDTIYVEDACHAQNMHEERLRILNIINETLNERMTHEKTRKVRHHAIPLGEHMKRLDEANKKFK